jgi:hypothetical protein
VADESARVFAEARWGETKHRLALLERPWWRRLLGIAP